MSLTLWRAATPRPLPVSCQPGHQKAKRLLTAPEPAWLQIASARASAWRFDSTPGEPNVASSRVESMGQHPTILLRDSADSPPPFAEVIDDLPIDSSSYRLPTAKLT